MIDILLSALAPLRRYLALGSVILLLCLGGWLWLQQKRVANLTEQLALVSARADQAEAANRQLKDNAEREIQALVNHYKTNQARIDAARQREREIRNVDPKDDAPCAPVLCGSLERLRAP